MYLSRLCRKYLLPLPAFAMLYSAHAVCAQTIDLSRLVVVGDSLSAGVQNISLLDTQQPNGYAALVAKQARVPLVLPLVKYPGIPNVLELKGFNPLPEVQAVTATLPTVPRDNPDQQPTNLAEPGTTVAGALIPPAGLPAPVGPWGKIVLSSPAYPDAPLSQVQEAVALKPSTIILWLGSNDALVPALIGNLALLTPAANFAGAFHAVTGALASTGASMIVANIPDITKVPYFTSVKQVSSASFLPVGYVASLLGTGTGDYLRTGALPLALDIILHKTSGPLPAMCPAPFDGFPSPIVTCVMTAADATAIRAMVDAYNNAIQTEVNSLNAAKPNSAILVDSHSLVDDIYANGYNVPGRELTTGMLGGLFSLDGIHPTNTGYAVIANRFIETMNAKFNTKIPLVDVAGVARRDPLVFRWFPFQSHDR